MQKTPNNRAWFLVLPMFLLVAFNAIIPLMAEAQDEVMSRIEKSGLQGACGPKLNPKSDPSKWLSNDHAPRAKLANEKPKGVTMPYKQIMKEMLDGKLPL